MKNLFASHRILSLIVALAIILSVVPVSAAAQGVNVATSGVTHPDETVTDNKIITEDETPVATSATTAAVIVGIVPSAGTAVTDTASLNAAIAAFNSGSADMTIEIAANFTTDSVTAITEINNNNAAQKLTITSSSGGVKTIKRGKSGDLINVTKGELILGNITIDGDKSGSFSSGGGKLVTVALSGSLTMNDGAKLQNNTNTGLGGGVYVSSGGTFTMNGGTISGNTADDSNGSGGGVHNFGKFTMAGGTISGNATPGSNGKGGGVYNDSGGTFTMNGGTISGNTADGSGGSGGGVYNNDESTFTMNGGTISGNTASTNGGGVHTYWGTFNISGSPKIENNIKGAGSPQGTGGVYLTSSSIKIDTAHLTAGAKIGIEGVSSGTTVATSAAASDLQYFYISNATGEIGGNNGFVFDTGSREIRLGTLQKFYVKSTGDDSNGNGTSVNPYATIAKAYGAINAGGTGEILIIGEIETPTITLTGTKTVTLKSASGTQTIKRGATGNLITVGSGITLILENITIDGGNKVSGAYAADGGGSLVKVESGGSLTMNGGAVLRNNSYLNNFGGGVYNGGTFNMSGTASISGNTAGSGGGVSNYNGGKFTMSGGTISTNTARDGGGVLNDISTSIFIMSGGTISGNTANGLVSNGGGVLNNDGTFTMTGGTISGNRVDGDNWRGGGVHNNGTFTVGGTVVIKGNTDSNAAANNVHLYTGRYITLGTGANEPANGMEVYVQGANGDVIVNSGAAANHAQYFQADDPALDVDINGDQLKLVPAKTVTVAAQNGTLTAGTAGSVTFNVVTENIADGTAISLNNKNSVAGISLTPTVTTNDSTNITISTTTATPQGSHPLTLTIGGKTSGSFNLTVNAAPPAPPAPPSGKTDAEKVAEDKAALTFNSIKGVNPDQGNIKNNLILPSSGANGSAITWSSNDTSVITNGGAVIRPEFSAGDKTVTLTATVTNGSASDTVIFNLVIKAKEQKQITVETKPDTPQAEAEGLDDLFTQDDTVLLQNNPGASIEIKLVVEKLTAVPAQEAAAINGELGGKTLGLYLDATLMKIISNAGNDSGTTSISDAAQPITITIELPTELQNMPPYSVIRVHNGVAEALPTTYNQANQTITFTTDKFSIYAIAFTTQSPTNPPVNPPGSSSRGGSSGGGSGAGTSTVVSTYWIEVAEAKAMAKTAKEKELDYVRSRRSTITGIRKNSLLALAGLHYRHDTVADSAVQVRVYVDDPAKATKDIFVSGYAKGNIVDIIKAGFEKWFTNKVAVVSLDQQGDFGMIVRIAAKLDLSGMDMSNLYFYGFNRQTK